MADNRHLFSLRLPHELHRQLNALAGVRGLSVSELILGWVGQAWEKAPEREGILNLLAPNELTKTQVEGQSEPHPPK